MAKTYLDIVKYLIGADFSIDGLVDKPDIIGAVFGQTEGLLGDELDLRELQKNGKIGRIEIDMNQSSGKTFGKLHLPASLDRIETCILAAAVESVDRVGPYDAKFRVEKVEDTRTDKRRKLLARAKELVKMLLTTEMPDSKELSELVQADVKQSDIVEYGPEKLPAGPNIDKMGDIILVEGRADVLNLLRNDITNVIAIGGATSNIPRTLVKLSNEKEITVFLDGDKGGDMILRTLLSVAHVDFVAKAPEGKEVEELQRKEVIKALRTKIPLDQYLNMNKTARPQSMVGGRTTPLPSSASSSFGPSIASQIRSSDPEFGRQMQGERPSASGSMQMQRQEQRFERKEATSQRGQEQRYESREQTSRQSRGADLSDIEDEPAPIARMESTPISRPQKTMFNTQVDVRPAAVKPAMESMVLTQLGGGLEELNGTLRSRIYGPEGNMVKELPIRELIAYLQDSTDLMYGVVLDGVITQRLVELALLKNVRAIYGLKANPMPKKHPELIIYTKEQGKLE